MPPSHAAENKSGSTHARMASWALGDDGGEDDFLSRLEQKINGIQNMGISVSPPVSPVVVASAASSDGGVDAHIPFSTLSPMSSSAPRRTSLGTLLNDDLGLSDIEGLSSNPSSPRSDANNPSLSLPLCTIKIPQAAAETATPTNTTTQEGGSGVDPNRTKAATKGLSVSELRTSQRSRRKVSTILRADDCFDRASVHHPKHINHFLTGKVVVEKKIAEKPWQRKFNASGIKQRFLNGSTNGEQPRRAPTTPIETFDHGILPLNRSPFVSRSLDYYTVSTPAPRLPASALKASRGETRKDQRAGATPENPKKCQQKKRETKDFISLNKTVKPKKKAESKTPKKRRISWKERNLKNTGMAGSIGKARETSRKLSNLLAADVDSIYVKSPWHGKPARNHSSRQQFLSGSTGGSFY